MMTSSMRSIVAVCKRLTSSPLAIATLACLLAFPSAFAQDSVLVATNGLSVFTADLQNLTKAIGGGWGAFSVALDPKNPRLAYVAANTYISVFDVSIGREVNRIYGVSSYGYLAFTQDGKYLLVEDIGNAVSVTLDVIDLARQAIVRRVPLAPVMGTGGYSTGSIVVVGNKAYVTSAFPDQNRPYVAVVDLRTYRLKPIRLPAAGAFDGYYAPNAAVTPDQKYVVVAQTNNSDFTFHLLFIDTATDKVVLDVPQANDPYGIVVTPVNTGNVYGYLLTDNGVVILDLKTGSPNFGKQVPGTQLVGNGSYFPIAYSAAINSDGSRLVLGGYKVSPTPPQPNVIEFDTALMITNPSASIIGHATAGSGRQAYGVAVGPATTTPPSSAPTVAAVTGPVSNGAPSSVTVTGTNFLPGATVRVGTNPPIPATVGSSTSLQATVPQNAPAQANLDVVVTNPNTTQARNQQYQSGVLAGALTIQPTLAFQPQNQFGAFGYPSMSVYQPAQGTMLQYNGTLYTGTLLPRAVAFNTDGATINGETNGQWGQTLTPMFIGWNPKDFSLTNGVAYPSTSRFVTQVTPSALAASVNPATGNSVIFYPMMWVTNGKRDLVVEMYDSDSQSNTYNTVVGHFAAGLNSNRAVNAYACAATPDGTYVYVNFSYFSGTATVYAIAIVDVVHGSVTSIPAHSLGVITQQSQMTVSPDGSSLLVSGYGPANPYGGAIAVLDISKQPTNPVLVATISSMSPSQPGGASPLNLYSFQVVGKRLFALSGNWVLAFNFDRANSNFARLASYNLKYSGGALAVSPDGALVYVSHPSQDMISVLDADKLATGQDPLITAIGAFPGVSYPIVSPAAINPNQLKVATSSLPSGTQGVAYSASLAATGGTPPYTWVVTGGSLPAGLTSSPGGAITGTPSGIPGPNPFTVTVTDSKGITAVSGGLGIQIQAGAPLQITTVSLPQGPVGTPYYASLGATGGVPPYTWTITAGSLPTGLSPLSPNGVISGTPTLGGNYPFTVQVADSAANPAKSTAPLSITISTNGNTSVLSGTYAFSVSGFQVGAWAAAYVGSFVADGNGNITSGIVDINSANGSPHNIPLTGTYSVNATGIGTILLKTGGNAWATIAFVLSSDGNGRIIQYDDATGHGNRGSGVLRKQDTTAFSLGSVIGNYAFGMSGANRTNNPAASVGEFYSDGAGVMYGSSDANASGAVSNYIFTGFVSAVDPLTGRATVTIYTPNGASNLAAYVVSGGELLMIEIDDLSMGNFLVSSGTALHQVGAGSFSNASLNGLSVVEQQTQDVGQGGAKAQLLLLNTDGAGHFSVKGDSNQGGSISQETDSGTYVVSSNGRTTTGTQGPILYLIDKNRAFALDTGSSVGLGTIEPQAPGPFSNASVMGSYVGGTLIPVELGAQNSLDAVSADGAGTVISSEYSSGPSGLNQGTGFNSLYNIAPNGRGSTPDGTVIYLLSPGKFVVLPNDSNPTLQVYEH